MGANAELTGRRRTQRGGDPTATPLGARVERRVGLRSKALTPVVSKRDHPQLVPARVVDDAEWEPADREATSSVPPMCAKPRLFTEQRECALELVDEFGS